ncbi:MAG: hypothetical protein H7320_22130 [Ferruginibacter sp.]|nr:hypothetical protein [Ferruginibacter sp.]
MKKKLSIQIKAAFMLIVFSLNTVVGFACAIGIDMGFNASHHHHEANEAHSHADIKGPNHHDEFGKGHDEEAEEIHSHEDGTNIVHHDEAIKNIDNYQESFSEKEGCCNDEVQKFQNLDKDINQSAKIAINAPAIVAIISVFFITDKCSLLNEVPAKYKDRFFYPPPPDIRILIQSFQI